MTLKIPPPIVGFICALIMWGLAANTHILQFDGAWVLWLAGLLVGLGLALDLFALVDFRRADTTVNPLAPEKASALVLRGPYRFTRNPMYLGMLLILTGIAVWLGSGLNIVVLLAFVAYITAFQIKPEERHLAVKFGPEYLEYKRKVRRWI